MCPELPPRPQVSEPPRPEVVLVNDQTSISDLDALRNAVERRHPGQVLVVGKDDDRIPENVRELVRKSQGSESDVILPVRRRRSPTEAMMLMAALSLGSLDSSAVEIPRRKG
jgi:hypothetical protein